MAGKRLTRMSGAPSGDDFHVLWIDPRDSKRMILGVDQGAIVSVDGGKTWSSWYNQPTGQFYHVSTDNTFPYRVYAAQQDSGTAGVLSRSDYGEILVQDWYSIGGFEYAFITPDPAHSNYRVQRRMVWLRRSLRQEHRSGCNRIRTRTEISDRGKCLRWCSRRRIRRCCIWERRWFSRLPTVD